MGRIYLISHLKIYVLFEKGWLVLGLIYNIGYIGINNIELCLNLQKIYNNIQFEKKL